MSLLFLYNNFPQQSSMQVLATPPLLGKQKRSLSYNDLKRKRLMRSAQSQKHLGSAQNSTAKKGMSQAKTIISSLPRDENVIKGCIEELKGVLGSLRSRSSKKRIISVRESLTERPSARSSIDPEDGGMWGRVEQAGDTKQLIKKLLDKNKSQRRLVKLNEVRDKLKKEKERSLSNDKPAVKAIPSPLKELRDKTVVNMKKKPTAEPIHINSTQTVPKSSSHQFQQQLDRLQKCSSEEINKLWAQQLGKENQQANINSSPLHIADISSIQPAQPVHGDSFTNSQLKLLQTSQSQPIQGSFLQLLNQNACPSKQGVRREARRRGDLERVKRIFPSGFFDN